MNNVRKQKRANKSLPFFFKDEFKVSFIIIFISTILLITTFSFDIVPPILNRGIQPATFPKGLLVLIISLTLIVYYLSFKTNLSNLNKLFKKKNSFRGKIGIFDIKNNKINHRLNFYKIEDKKIIEIF